MTAITIISRYTPREVTPHATFRELGLDCIDRTCIAMDVDEMLGCDVPDAEIEAWSSVADVSATIAGLSA